MSRPFALSLTTLADASTTEAAVTFLPGQSVGQFAMGDVDLTCPSCAAPLVRGLGSAPNRLFAGVAIRCVCGTWSRIPNGTPWSALPGSVEARPIGPLYRYFDSEAYRRAFLAGDIWTTTIHACRGHPNDVRADSGEGTLVYTHDPVYGYGRDPHVRAIAGRLGVHVGPNTEIMIENCSVHRESPDAWMLCVSREFSPTLLQKFGAYCVRIEKPAALFTAMADAIEQSTPLKLGGYRRVHYRARAIHNLDPEPGSEVFVKPPSYQEE